MRQQLLLWTLILTAALTVGLSGLGHAQTLSGQGNIGNGSNGFGGGAMALQQIQSQIKVNQNAITGITGNAIPNLQTTLDDYGNRLTNIENRLTALENALSNLQQSITNLTNVVNGGGGTGTNGNNGTPGGDGSQISLDQAAAGTFAGVCVAKNGYIQQYNLAKACSGLVAPAICTMTPGPGSNPCGCRAGWTRVYLNSAADQPPTNWTCAHGSCPNSPGKFTCRKL